MATEWRIRPGRQGQGHIPARAHAFTVSQILTRPRHRQQDLPDRALPVKAKAAQTQGLARLLFMVPRRGLEPPRLAAHGPEPCASTNSATWAGRVSRVIKPSREGCQRGIGKNLHAASNLFPPPFRAAVSTLVPARISRRGRTADRSDGQQGGQYRSGPGTAGKWAGAGTSTGAIGHQGSDKRISRGRCRAPRRPRHRDRHGNERGTAGLRPAAAAEGTTRRPLSV